MARFSGCNMTDLMNTLLSNSSVSVHSINSTCQNSSVALKNSTSDATNTLPVAVKYACYVFYGLVLFFGTIGNILIFNVIGYRKKKRNSGDIYMLSLASADLLASFVAPLAMLNDLITDSSSWLYGEMLCYVVPAVTPATMCASAWTLVLISFDRLRIISKPMTLNLRRTYLYGSIAAVWLSSVGISIPYILRLELKHDTCLLTNSKILHEKNYTVFTGIFVLYIWCIPILIMAFVYYLTARSLKANTFKHESSRAMKTRQKQNAKAVKMFAVVVVVFLLLTVPYGIFYFYATYMLSYKAIDDIMFYATLNNVLFIPASANGCVNPLIYAKMHRETNRYVREILQQITSLLCKCCHKESKNIYNPSLDRSAPSTKTDQSSKV